MATHRRLGDVVAIPSECLCERLERDAESVVATPGEHERALAVRTLREFRRQPRLADARFPGEEDGRCASAPCLLPRGGEAFDLFRSPRECHGAGRREQGGKRRTSRIGGGFPRDRPHRDRFGDSLQLDASVRSEIVRDTRPADRAHETAHEDLIRGREGTEACGFVRGEAVEVVGFVDQVAGADADA